MAVISTALVQGADLVRLEAAELAHLEADIVRLVAIADDAERQAVHWFAPANRACSKMIAVQQRRRALLALRDHRTDSAES